MTQIHIISIWEYFKLNCIAIDLNNIFNISCQSGAFMSKGRYGVHGGQFVPEVLMEEVNAIEEAYERFREDKAFMEEFETFLKEYAGRPSLLYYAKNMTEDLGGAKIYLKREDLNHTGAHKINNVHHKAYNENGH